MDDGMQFAQRPEIDTTKTVYSARNGIFSCKSNDRAAVQAFVDGWIATGIQVEMVISEPEKEDVIIESEQLATEEVESSDVVVQNVEAVKVSTETIVQAVRYLDWNNATKRYEAKEGDSLYCVDLAAWHNRLDRECGPQDDIERVASWLLRLSNWNFSGKHQGVYMLEVSHV